MRVNNFVLIVLKIYLSLSIIFQLEWIISPQKYRPGGISNPAEQTA